MILSGAVKTRPSIALPLGGAGSVGSSTTVRFLFPLYSDTPAEVIESGLVAPRSGVLRNLKVRHNIPDGNGQTVTYTVRKNKLDSLVKVDLPSTSLEGSDAVNSVAVAAGDLISVKVTKALGVNASPRNIVVTAELA